MNEHIWKQNWFEFTGYVPHAGQRKIHFSQKTDAKYFVYVCGRRFGKSLAASKEIEAMLAKPNTRSWIVAPDHSGTDKVFREVWNTVVHKGLMEIKIQSGISMSNMDLTITVTMTDLEVLIATSAGSITGTNLFNADNVSLNLSSAGDIRLALSAENVQSTLSSAGDLYLEGDATHHSATLSSAGDLYAFNFATKTTNVTLSSAGNAHIYASQRLYATVTSAGSVYYKGHPWMQQTTTSQGRVVNSNP